MRDNDGRGGRVRSIWTALAIYALAGWATVEIALVVRERLGLPGIVEPIMLGLFAAGFLATILLASLRWRQHITPIAQGLQLVAITIACAAMAIGVATWLQVPGSTTDEVSVVVLPCDYGGDKAHEYLGRGLAEEVHTRLGSQRELRVPSWRAVLKVQAIDSSPEFAAEHLNVDHVATCRVRREGERVIVEAQILNPPAARPLLQRRYESVSTDLPATIAEIAGTFVDQIAPRIKANQALRRLPTSDPEAFELYLHANAVADPAFHANGPVLWSEQISEIESLLGRAIALDPDFGDAYGRLASLQWEYAELATHDSAEVRDGLRDRALSNVLKALALDDCSAFGWYTAGMMRYGGWYADRSDEYRRLLERVDEETMARNAIRCRPNDAYAWISLFDYYTMYQDREPKTVEELFELITGERQAIARAAALDPVDCLVAGAYAASVFLEGYPFARRSVADQRSFMDDPEAWRTRRAIENLEAEQRALDSIRSLLAIAPNCGYAFSRLSLYYASSKSRRLDTALAWAIKTNEADPEWSGVPKAIAELYLDMGMLEQAEQWARRAAEQDYEGSDILAVTQLLQRNTAPILERIQRGVDHAVDSSDPALKKRVYGRAAKEAAWAGEFDFAASLLEQGMAELGIADPVALLPEPRSLSSRRTYAMYWALAYQRVGLDAKAKALLDESRWRDPVFAKATDYYERSSFADARYQALAGDPGGALELIRRSVDARQSTRIPGLYDLVRDPILDSIREHPEYGPELQDLIEEFDAALTPMRENVLKAETTGNWEPLLVY